MTGRPHRTPSRASSRGGSRVSEGGDDAISMTTLSLGESAEDNLDDGTDIFPDQMFKDSIEQLYEKRCAAWMRVARRGACDGITCRRVTRDSSPVQLELSTNRSTKTGFCDELALAV